MRKEALFGVGSLMLLLGTSCGDGGQPNNLPTITPTVNSTSADILHPLGVDQRTQDLEKIASLREVLRNYVNRNFILRQQFNDDFFNKLMQTNDTTVDQFISHNQREDKEEDGHHFGNWEFTRENGPDIIVSYQVDRYMFRSMISKIKVSVKRLDEVLPDNLIEAAVSGLPYLREDMLQQAARLTFLLPEDMRWTEVVPSMTAPKDIIEGDIIIGLRGVNLGLDGTLTEVDIHRTGRANLTVTKPGYYFPPQG